MPLLELPARISGSGAAYCAAGFTAHKNNENTLMLLDRAAIALVPSLTLNELARLFSRLRFLLVAAFAVLLIRSGASYIYALAVAILTMQLVALLETDMSCSLYPFLVPFLLGYIAFAALAVRLPPPVARGGPLLAGAVLGAFAALFFNLRSSYLPVIIAGVCGRRTAPRATERRRPRG